MMFGSNVAPKRKVIAKKYVPWECRCDPLILHRGLPCLVTTELPPFKKNPGYLVRCVDCKTERP